MEDIPLLLNFLLAEFHLILGTVTDLYIKQAIQHTLLMWPEVPSEPYGRHIMSLKVHSVGYALSTLPKQSFLWCSVSKISSYLARYNLLPTYWQHALQHEHDSFHVGKLQRNTTLWIVMEASDKNVSRRRKLQQCRLSLLGCYAVVGWVQ
jgi:hypothetical protein